MTSKVTIDPQGHSVEVTTTEAEKTTVNMLHPGDRPMDVFLYSDRVLTIREVPE